MNKRCYSGCTKQNGVIFEVYRVYTIIELKIHTWKSNPHIYRTLGQMILQKIIDNDIRLSETIQKPHDISTSTLCSIDIFFI